MPTGPSSNRGRRGLVIYRRGCGCEELKGERVAGMYRFHWGSAGYQHRQMRAHCCVVWVVVLVYLCFACFARVALDVRKCVLMWCVCLRLVSCGACSHIV